MSISVVKAVKRYGNSGGVYLPSNWVGGKVKIELVEEPINPKIDILTKLDLTHVISGFVYGSYARKELEEKSDIDVLLIADDDSDIKIPAELKQKYDIQVRKLRDVRNAIIHDPIFYKVLKDEAVPILNHLFLDDLLKEIPGLGDVRNRISLAESSLKIIKRLAEENDNRNLVYPIMLRLKEILLIGCFLENKKYSIKALKKEVLDCGIKPKEFSALIDIYRSIRDSKPVPKIKVSNDIIMRLVSLAEEKISHVKKKCQKRN